MALISIGIAINDMSVQDNKKYLLLMSIIHPLSVQKASLKECALICTDPKYSKIIFCVLETKVELPMFEKPYGNIHIECMLISFSVRLLS